MKDRVEDLHSAIQNLLASYDEPAISANRPINELLEIWALASAIDPSVAAPVESLLTALVGRELTTGGELREVMDDVELALLALEETSAV